MFAVTGITGKVGAAVARSLLSADQPVRAVIRDRSKGAPWARLGCDVVVADLSDTEALSAAFEGANGVFAVVPPVFDPAPGFPEAIGFINSLRAALGRAKPARVVALSTVGADAPHPNLLNVLGRMEEALDSLPMPLTFLRAAWFMENAAWDLAPAFRAQGMKNPTPRMQMIDGFNSGWIDFPDRGAHARKGSINIDQAIATLIERERA